MGLKANRDANESQSLAPQGIRRLLFRLLSSDQ